MTYQEERIEENKHAFDAAALAHRENSMQAIQVCTVSKVKQEQRRQQTECEEDTA